MSIVSLETKGRCGHHTQLLMVLWVDKHQKIPTKEQKELVVGRFSQAVEAWAKVTAASEDTSEDNKGWHFFMLPSVMFGFGEMGHSI